MQQRNAQTLGEPYRSRIDFRAQGRSAVTSLKVRHGSGKTLVLEVVAPGMKPRCVLRLHRKFHKTFYAMVKLAEDWLKGYQALYSPVQEPLILIPASVANVVSTSGLLAVRDTLYRPEVNALKRNAVASRFYKGKDIYGPGLRELAKEVAQEAGRL